MTSPAVVALKCTVKGLDRIDRGQILYAVYDGKPLPTLQQNGTSPSSKGTAVAVVTAEAVTLYKGQTLNVSVPIVVLGKTEVLLRDSNNDTSALFSNSKTVLPGTKIYMEYNDSDSITKLSFNANKTFLGTAVHSITASTHSVDLIVNFAQ